MGNYTLIIQMVAMAAVFYFFIIRPQQKKAKKEKEFEKKLKVGDKIITKSGFHGKIFELTDSTVIIETMAGKLKIERSALSLELSSNTNKKVL